MLQPRIVDVRALADNRIEVVFETGETAFFDVGPYISGGWYGRLADPAYFKTVHVADGGAGIAWAEGQDLAPHELYAARTR
jgi:hypothetical protein